MAGHSKFKNIMHRKGAQDKRRGKIFTKIQKEIYVAVKVGGDDINSNPRLRMAIADAKSNNMPKDNIERAIKKASGANDGENYEDIRYEGYAQGGVAIIVEALTDNRNRTAGEVRACFSKNGGNLGETGSVNYMFERLGVVTFSSEGLNFEEVFEEAINLGAEDIIEDNANIEIKASIDNFIKISSHLEDKFKKEPISTEISWIPKVTVEILDSEVAKKIIKLINALEDLDDVQNVYANFDISEEIINSLD